MRDENIRIMADEELGYITFYNENEALCSHTF